ncbi:hypothetical protein AFL22_19690 [Pantoea sp. CFSAN033090]|nr:hypothetical protein AFL22_19690 [Pantoea sp. CFSAN033090]
MPAENSFLKVSKFGIAIELYSDILVLLPLISYFRLTMTGYKIIKIFSISNVFINYTAYKIFFESAIFWKKVVTFITRKYIRSR